MKLKMTYSDSDFESELEAEESAWRNWEDSRRGPKRRDYYYESYEREQMANEDALRYHTFTMNEFSYVPMKRMIPYHDGYEDDVGALMILNQKEQKRKNVIIDETDDSYYGYTYHRFEDIIRDNFIYPEPESEPVQYSILREFDEMALIEKSCEKYRVLYLLRFAESYHSFCDECGQQCHLSICRRCDSDTAYNFETRLVVASYTLSARNDRFMACAFLEMLFTFEETKKNIWENCSEKMNKIFDWKSHVQELATEWKPLLKKIENKMEIEFGINKDCLDHIAGYMCDFSKTM